MRLAPCSLCRCTDGRHALDVGLGAQEADQSGNASGRRTRVPKVQDAHPVCAQAELGPSGNGGASETATRGRPDPSAGAHAASAKEGARHARARAGAGGVLALAAAAGEARGASLPPDGREFLLSFTLRGQLIFGAMVISESSTWASLCGGFDASQIHV